MKRIVIGMGVVAAMLFTASSALAAGVSIAWSACLSDLGPNNRNSACTSNNGTNAMVGTFLLDADKPGVTGIEVVIDLISATSPLPAWWDMGTFVANTCRPTSVTANPTIAATATNCIDWSGGAAAGGLANYQSTLPLGQEWSIAPANEAAHRRVKIGFAVGTAVNLLASTDYFGFNLLVNNAKTTGLGACDGCLTPVCIVLNSILLAAGADPLLQIKLTGGTAPGADRITWQGGAGADCQAVPVRNTTWGQVKSLYR